MRIKVINPNTTAGMTAKIGEAARLVAARGTDILAVNPAVPPVSIESHGVAAAVKLIEALVGLGVSTSKRGDLAWPDAKPYSGNLASFAPSGGALRRARSRANV